MTFQVQATREVLAPQITDAVATWALEQRWYPGGSASPPTPWFTLHRASDPLVVILCLRAGGPAVQVPLVLRDTAANCGPPPSHIATVANTSVSDGGRDPAVWQALLSEALGEIDLAAAVVEGRVLAGEQSNTSVLLPNLKVPGASKGAMLKILRTLAPGKHPDVEVPQALTAVGFTGVPRFLGAASAQVPLGPSEGEVWVDLAVLSELITDAADGFELACDYASRDESFVELAAAFGTTLAGLHQALQAALPTNQQLDPNEFVAALRLRAEQAIDLAPALEPHARAITGVLDDLQQRLQPVPLQRIHGDLHLGQALWSASDRTWKLLDFEGEPERPVAERTKPDLPLRDVAGMLRSFDYAAAVGETSNQHWAHAAQEALLRAYQQATGQLDQAILRALVLDKALYEVVYETRHRPHWIGIPLAAVERIIDGSSA